MTQALQPASTIKATTLAEQVARRLFSGEVYRINKTIYRMTLSKNDGTNWNINDVENELRRDIPFKFHLTYVGQTYHEFTLDLIMSPQTVARIKKRFPKMIC